MQFKDRPRRKVVLNITSMTDLLFLLLIFFVVSTTFLEQPGIKLELPHAKSAVISEQKDYTLFVDKEGKMYLNDEGVSTENLGQKLKAVLPNMKEAALILKADQDVAHGIVVRVMDIAKQSGVKKLIIGTKLEE